MNDTEQQNDRVMLTPEQAEEVRVEARKRIENADALERLMKNDDFKKVFMKGYLEEESTRHTLMLGETSGYSSEESKKFGISNHTDALLGIAMFHQYLRRVYGIAQMAEKDLHNLEEAQMLMKSEG